MRKDDHTMMVVTGLVIAIGIGIVSERMSNGFGGPDVVAGQPVDDHFMLRAGSRATLDILSNDGNLQGNVRLIDKPSCGVASVGDNKLIYESGLDCSGKDAFSYCVGDRKDCVPATVYLTLQENTPKSTTEETQDVAALKTKLDLEPLHPQSVIKSAPEFALIPTKRIADADLKVFVATMPQPAQFRPVRVVRQYLAPTDQVSLNAIPTTFRSDNVVPLAPHPIEPERAAGFLRSYAVSEQSGTLLDIAALDQIKVASVPDEGNLDIVLPGQRAVFAEPRHESVSETQQIEQVAARFDNEVPTDVGCDVDASLSPAPGAHVTLTLSAPCLAGKHVVAVSEGLEFLLTVSEEGSLVADLPTLALEARVRVEMGEDVAPLDLSADGSEILTVERGVFRLDAGTGLAVAAVELTDGEDPREVTYQNELAHRQAFLNGQGYVRRYKSTQGRVIDVYTLPLSRQVTARAVQMRLVRSNPGVCQGALKFEYMVLGAEDAQMTMTKLPVTACASKSGYSLRRIAGPIQVAGQ